ncbi:MAG TPA: hypothetical protein VHD59_05830 [Pseudolabrys sp.]|nr:hypothetical protein [Pseudolabrys sp.]
MSPLPDKVAASLLRVLLSLQPAPEQPLILKRPSAPRAPNWDVGNDFDVFFLGRRVGRVWRHEYRLHPYEGWPWHWTFKNLEGGTEADGHGLSLEAALADFRAAWNVARKKGVA